MNVVSSRLLPVFALIAAVLVGCKTSGNNPSALDPAGEVPPSEYGQPGEEIPPPGGGTGGRFGYSGNETGQTPAPPRPGENGANSGRFGANTPTAPEPEPEKKDPPKPSGPPASANMPFANKVPGNPLAVTLPGANASLGQISIEKYDSAGNPTGEPLKRGTQVQIPDPNNPGNKIYFKVP